jgi:hypothetical protein
MDSDRESGCGFSELGSAEANRNDFHGNDHERRVCQLESSLAWASRAAGIEWMTSDERSEIGIWTRSM